MSEPTPQVMHLHAAGCQSCRSLIAELGEVKRERDALLRLLVHPGSDMGFSGGFVAPYLKYNWNWYATEEAAISAVRNAAWLG